MTSSQHEAIDAPAWTIRPEAAVDLDQIHELHREAFRRPEEPELVDAIRSGPDFIPELSLVAVADDGSVLGHILLSRVRFEPHEETAAAEDVLALAPLAVLPPYAGRGIGSALTRTALAIADRRDERFTVVLGAQGFYGRFGFVPAADLGVDGPYADAGPAFAVRPRPGAELPPPGTVIYPAKFEAV